jgi:hypothetical protein
VVGHPIGGDWTTPIGGWGGFNHPKPGGPTTPEGQTKKKKKKKILFGRPWLVWVGRSHPQPPIGVANHTFSYYFIFYFFNME